MPPAALPPPSTETRLGVRSIARALIVEGIAGAGALLFRFVTDVVLFPEGDIYCKLRGRLYTWLFGWGHGVGVGKRVQVRSPRSVSVGRYSRIRPDTILIGPLTIGEHCNIGERSVIYAGATIEDRVSTGPLVYVITTWHPIGPAEQRAAPLQQKATRVGAGACLNAGAMILPGCDVGAGAVVAGGAKVTRRVPPNVIVAGNPAEIVRRLDEGPRLVPELTAG